MGSRRVAPQWVAVVASAGAGAAHAQDALSGVSGYFTLSSGYWKHGVAQTDGASLQVGIDYQHHSGFFAYARAMNIDYPQLAFYKQRDVETSVYLGFHDRGQRWSWTVSAGRYWYTDRDAYDYDEWSASVGFRDRVFYSAFYSDSYYGSSALNQEFTLTFPLPRNFEVGGALGFLRVSGGPDFTHFNVGASKLLGRMAVDLRYYDGDYGAYEQFGDPDADNYVLSVSYALKRTSR